MLVGQQRDPSYEAVERGRTAMFSPAELGTAGGRAGDTWVFLGPSLPEDLDPQVGTSPV